MMYVNYFTHTHTHTHTHMHTHTHWGKRKGAEILEFSR